MFNTFSAQGNFKHYISGTFPCTYSILYIVFSYLLKLIKTNVYKVIFLYHCQQSNLCCIKKYKAYPESKLRCAIQRKNIYLQNFVIWITHLQTYISIHYFYTYFQLSMIMGKKALFIVGVVYLCCRKFASMICPQY